MILDNKLGCPMHLHGHHMLVLSRGGKSVEGTWWSDTLDVLPGDTYEVALQADNPGIWMDHCRNLRARCIRNDVAFSV